MTRCRHCPASLLGFVLVGCSILPASAQFLQQQQQQQQGAQVPRLRPAGLLTMRSLRVANTAAEGSRVFFGPQSEWSIGEDGSGSFVVQKSSDPVPLLALNSQNVLSINARQTQVLSLDIGAQGSLSIRGVKQWVMVAREDFSSSSMGWTSQQTSQCGGVFMLGGFCKFSNGEVNKTFTGLPPHSQLRIVATFHFIDHWIGEAGFLKLNIGQYGEPVVVWSEQHAQGLSTNGVSLCGQQSTPEGKFAVPIDISIPHNLATVQLSFGSTMQNADPCDESWGVSGVEVYVRA